MACIQRRQFRALRHIRPRLTMLPNLSQSASSVRVSITVTVCSMAPLSATSTVFSVSRTHLPVWLLKLHVVPVPLTYGVSCTGCRSASVSASSSWPLHPEPSILAHRLTLRVSCIGINHWGHCALALLPICTGLTPSLTSTNTHLQSRHRLPGTI